MDRESLLRVLADNTLGEERAKAAAQLQAAGLKVVATKERDAVEVEATLEMWEYPHAVQLWGRKRLPVVDPGEVLVGKEVELDPIDLTELSDDFNHATAADWADVSNEHRALVRYGVKTGRLQVAEPLDLVDQLRQGKLPPRLAVLQAEATPDDLAAAAKELRRVKPPHQLASVATGADERRQARLVGGGVEWLTLTDFLADAFSPNEMQRFVSGYYHRCVKSISWQAAPKTVAFNVVTQLQNHGVLTDAFWQALARARPGRAAEIVALQEAAPRI